MSINSMGSIDCSSCVECLRPQHVSIALLGGVVKANDFTLRLQIDWQGFASSLGRLVSFTQAFFSRDLHDAPGSTCSPKR